MTTDRDSKRLVRARMQKTGESYTAARTHFAGRRPTPPKLDYARLAGRSDEILRHRTGCTWERWVRSLDRVRAHAWSHREIASHVRERYKVDGWWAQTVRAGYERIKGLRAIGQRRSGLWEASKSRTFAVPVDRLFRAFHDPRQRSLWLLDAKPTVQTAMPGKSIRTSWPDGTTVVVGFTAKGASKSQVAIQHEKLADQATAARAKAYWTERLDLLGDSLI